MQVIKLTSLNKINTVGKVAMSENQISSNNGGGIFESPSHTAGSRIKDQSRPKE